MIKKWSMSYPAVNGTEQRRAYVYLPTMYEAQPERRFPVLYMFDGQNVFFNEDATYGKSWGVADYLDYTDTPLIVAAIECNAGANNERLVEDIATMLNKSPAEVAAMMDLARAQGIIKGYKTLVDWEKAKVNRVEAVIELNVSPKKSRGFDEIAATIAAFDEVESVLLMSGGYDLQLVIKGQTFQEIALFVAKRLSPLDDVLSTATHFVLRTYKKEGRLYQDEEIDERECTVL